MVSARAGACSMLLVALLALAGCGGGGDAEPASKPAAPRSPSKAELIDQARQATVRISSETPDGNSGGTGLVLDDKRGFVLTNSHVISGASSIRVSKDGQRVNARVHANAPCEDVAVLELDRPLNGIRAAKLGASKSLREGQPVTLLGFPASPTGARRLRQKDGNVSAADIPAKIDITLPRYSSVVEHSALLGRGSSGGPLLNDRGEVVGLNTLGSDEFDQGYAIASDLVQQLLPELKAGKDLDDVGWDLTALTKEELVSELETEVQRSSAPVIYDVDAGTPAADARLHGDRKGSAELRVGDVILYVDETPVRSVADVCEKLKSARSGDTLELDVYTPAPTDAQYRVEMTLD